MNKSKNPPKRKAETMKIRREVSIRYAGFFHLFDLTKPGGKAAIDREFRRSFLPRVMRKIKGGNEE